MALFQQLKSGASVFLDANTLVYHFQPHPVFGQDCTQLLVRIDQQDLRGYTSTHILSELAHRLMMVEASTLPGWTASKTKLRLRQNPTVLSNLSRFRSAIDAILQSHIAVLTIAPSLIATATALSQQYGLLSNDALIMAVMQTQGLTNLASSDTDFDRVPGITRYTPA